ncbi:MAG: hypothetical protein RSE41_07710 [Clostridia bacterium]
MNKHMGCSCNSNTNLNCTTCNDYCNLCTPINSPTTEYFSNKYHSLENNYPMNKCMCSPFATNPRYYNPPYVPCNCKSKCYPC